MPWKWHPLLICRQVTLLHWNWCGSSVAGRQDFKCERTNLWKHLTMIGVSAKGWKSFREIAVEYCGTGTTEPVLNLVGTTACTRDSLKMSLKTLASCSAQAPSTCSDIQSGHILMKLWKYRSQSAEIKDPSDNKAPS